MGTQEEKGEATNEPLELGFGRALNASNIRLVKKDGSFNIERKGRRISTAYQSLVEMSWRRFLFIVLGLYISINALFALCLFALGVDNIGIKDVSGVEAFLSAFFFSVQTYTTVGYGVLSPNGIAANVIASLIALSGLLSVAMATGLVFARFSKPKAQIIFSQHALIAPYKDGWSFQFRIANQRNNSIINMQATLNMSWLETIDNEKIRHFSRLPLELDRISLFPLNWTLVHVIDENSPLNNCDQKILKEQQAEFLVIVEGYDETYAQKVHINSSYFYDEVKWFKKFQRMYHEDRIRGTIFDLSKIDAWEDI